MTVDEEFSGRQFRYRIIPLLSWLIFSLLTSSLGIAALIVMNSDNYIIVDPTLFKGIAIVFFFIAGSGIVEFILLWIKTSGHISVSDSGIAFSRGTKQLIAAWDKNLTVFLLSERDPTHHLSFGRRIRNVTFMNEPLGKRNLMKFRNGETEIAVHLLFLGDQAEFVREIEKHVKSSQARIGEPPYSP